jgi:branched-chain amino acid transport system permease protein
MTHINAVVQGILLGGLYALFATGLSLIFGVMRVVNLAHGALTVLGGYAALVLVEHTAIGPLLSVALVVPAMFVLGYVFQRLLVNPTLGAGLLPPLLVTFGFAVVVENVLLRVFSADSQGLDAGRIENERIRITAGLSIGWLPPWGWPSQLRGSPVCSWESELPSARSTARSC